MATQFHSHPIGFIVDGEYFVDSLGLQYMQILLAQPGIHFPAWQLAWPNRISEPLQRNRNNARTSVRKAIKRARKKLGECVGLHEIALHLVDHVTTGELCYYDGHWDWDIVPLVGTIEEIAPSHEKKRNSRTIPRTTPYRMDVHGAKR